MLGFRGGKNKNGIWLGVVSKIGYVVAEAGDLRFFEGSDLTRVCRTSWLDSGDLMKEYS